MVNYTWANYPPPPCTCVFLPPGFRLAASSVVTSVVLALGTLLYVLGHPVQDVLQLVGGLVVAAAALAWAVTTGRRLLPILPTPFQSAGPT
jgi:hypothetical protein